METKKCTKCGIEKNFSEFHKCSRHKDGVRGVCKICRKSETIKNREYYHTHKENMIIKKKEWLEKNPNYHKEYGKKYTLTNRDKLNEKQKRWREKNYETNILKARIKKKEKYNNDISFKIKHLLRCRINKIVKYKRNESSLKLLGCNIDEFIKYIETKFIDGMSWSNYGYYGWHIDHIIPLSSAKNEEELKLLCNYKNLQPLWGVDNIKKSNKIN
jgi:hypothetical protein